MPPDPPGEGLLHALGTRIIWLVLSREGVPLVDIQG